MFQSNTCVLGPLVGKAWYLGKRDSGIYGSIDKVEILESTHDPHRTGQFLYKVKGSGHPLLEGSPEGWIDGAQICASLGDALREVFFKAGELSRLLNDVPEGEAKMGVLLEIMGGVEYVVKEITTLQDSDMLSEEPCP